MALNLADLHLHWRSFSKNGKKYVSYSLARSIWVNSTCRKEIVLKLGKLDESEVNFWKERIKYEKAKRRGSTVATDVLTTIPKESDTVAIEIPTKDIEVQVSKKFAYDDNDRCDDIQSYEDAVKHAFAEVPDPRSKDNLLYPFYGLLLVILASTLGGARSITAVYEYSKAKAAILCPLLNLERPPSYSSFWWILARTNPEILNKAFIKWIELAAEALLGSAGRIISIDGKTLRGAKKSLVHYVSGYECTKGILLGQVKTEEKSNEITAIPELLKIIDVKDAMVTIDAMGCQTKIASDIRESGGHYTIALKGNQGTLHDEVMNFFEQAREASHKAAKCKVFISENEGHGRVEKREVVITQNIEWLDCRDDWRDLTSIIEVKSTRTIGEKTTTELRYYISSKKMNAKEAGSTIRAHWGIENGLHWAMDVIFNDDDVGANTGHIAENLGLFRRMAYCILKQETPGGKGRGLATQQRLAMWNEQYVFELLGKFIKEISAGSEIYKVK
jgi:predicted transposase YbfD/YdcC